MKLFISYSRDDKAWVYELWRALRDRAHHHYIGTEHLLLGLLRQVESDALYILKQLNISPEEVRRTVRRVLQERPLSPPATPSDSSNKG